jgi:glycosyltransferase involved in cell wall biosynthesis
LDRPLKISIIGVKGYPYVYGGYETLIKELVERLIHKNVQITVYCHRSLFKERPVSYQNVQLVYMPSIELKAFTQLVHSFLSTIHACFQKNDVLFYVNAANGPLGIITRLFGKKTVINVDGMEWLRPKWKGIGAKYYQIAAKMATKYFDIVVTDAYEMQKTYLELFNKQSTMIAYGSDKVQTAPLELLQKWGLATNEYYLIVGRLIPDNNAHLIVEAFLSIKSNKKLVIVGDDIFNDPYASNIKNSISLNKHANQLIFTGYVKDAEVLSALYQHSFIYIHGHEFGGTNPTIVKAMAEGTCILALNTRFNREVLQEGKIGDFFEKDAKSLANKMIEAEASAITEASESNWVKKYKENSPNGIRDIYQWDYIAAQYYQCFTSLQHEGNL